MLITLSVKNTGAAYYRRRLCESRLLLTQS